MGLLQLPGSNLECLGNGSDDGPTQQDLGIRIGPLSFREGYALE